MSWSLRGLLLAGFLAALAAAVPSSADSRVYLLRGLLDVSTGLDELAAKLTRRGIRAQVASYTAAGELAQRAIRDHKSGSDRTVIIVGHSLGADAAIEMAETLRGAGVPVALIVAFSPAASKAVPGNVGRIVNYYQSNSAWNSVYRPGAGFRGSLRNVDLARKADMHHFNIEKNARLHAEAIGMIASIGSAGGAGREEVAKGKAEPDTQGAAR